ncbi:MAG: ROK family protein [Candidatus Firestonebacteria bacterium]|mgnify:CR=1 FL=1
MSPNIAYAVGVDFGGTNIVAGIVNSKGKVVARIKIPTCAKEGKAKVLNRISLAIKEVLEKFKGGIGKIKGIGIGSPGLIDHIRGIVNVPPNLPGWKHVNLKKYLEAKFHKPVFVANDVNATALGESEFGAGKGVKNLICITLGTGVGGAIIINGKLYVGSHQFAGEIGHMTVERHGLRCNCGNIGCMERYVGCGFIAERAMAEIKKGVQTKITELVDGDLDKITPKILTDAAKLGDKLALKIWNETGEYLGITLASVVNFLDPEMIIVGGGVAQAGKYIFEPTKREIRKRAYKFLTKSLKIVPAKLGEDAGVIGSATLVLKNKGAM